MADYEYIVIGCGGVGSATLYHLARKSRPGERVLGLEQFELGHDHGGSQDHSRIIRYAYSDERYIPLARGTYEAWGQLEEEAGVQVLVKCGGLDLAQTDNSRSYANVEMYAKAMDKEGIEYERLEGLELHHRFPQFAPNTKLTALYQKDSGFVASALGNSLHIQHARKYGAEILENTTAQKIRRNRNGRLVVSTNRGDFTCRKVIVTAGAWLNGVLSSVGVNIPVTVTQEQVTYYATSNVKEFTPSRFPIFIWHSPGIDLYSIPIYGNSGFKLGIDAGGPAVTPSTRTYIPDPVREKICTNFLRDNIPQAVGPIMNTKTCLYTMTPDRHFVIDTAHRTGFPDVVICCGAGHAYKFAAVLGQILTQLAVDNHTEYNISSFTLDRPAITDPNFKKCFRLGDEEPVGKVSQIATSSKL